MGVPTVTLTDGALTGLTVGTEHRAMVSRLPQRVKLGRNRPKARPLTLHMKDYVKKLKDVPIPDKIDWYTKAAASTARMYLNDTYGDCVIAGKAHALGVWSANDPDSAPDVPGGVVLATDQEIYQQYQRICGPGDNGCNIPDVLDYIKAHGFTAGGKQYPIVGYVSADWRSKELTQLGLALFGAGTIGINLPSAWTGGSVWDVTNTRIVGGHDVTPAGYGANVIGTNADGVVIMSWGRLYLITWAAWVKTDHLEELYFMVPSVLWTGKDKKAPSGVDYDTLLKDLQMIGGGNLPPLPDPTPVPPVPPVPPSPPSPPVPPPAPKDFYNGPATFSGHIPIFGNVTIHGNIELPGSAGQTLGCPSAPRLGDQAQWQKIVEDFGHLAVDVGQGNYQNVYPDLLEIVDDLHIFGLHRTGTEGEQVASLVVPWWELMVDVAALGSAIMSQDVMAIVTALKKIAADFGLNLGIGR